MGKHRDKALARLQRRVKHYQDAGWEKDAAFRMPGSMNAHKSAPKGRK